MNYSRVIISLFQCVEKMHLVFIQRLQLDLIFDKYALANQILSDRIFHFLFKGKRVILLTFFNWKTEVPG